MSKKRNISKQQENNIKLFKDNANQKGFPQLIFAFLSNCMGAWDSDKSGRKKSFSSLKRDAKKLRIKSLISLIEIFADPQDIPEMIGMLIRDMDRKRIKDSSKDVQSADKVGVVSYLEHTLNIDYLKVVENLLKVFAEKHRGVDKNQILSFFVSTGIRHSQVKKLYESVCEKIKDSVPNPSKMVVATTYNKIMKHAIIGELVKNVILF